MGNKVRKIHTSISRAITAEFGQIAKLPALFGKPETVMTFNVEDVVKVFRTEGNFPVRLGMETLQHYRKNIRPDIYGEYGSLITE